MDSSSSFKSFCVLAALTIAYSTLLSWLFHRLISIDTDLHMAG